MASNRTRFDVFLSFRGEDTRHAFTDHLYTALKQAGIATFRDNDEIDRGEDLEPEIVKAIEESKASIVVLSENYGKSRWCLDELLLIIEQRRNSNHFVLPVFYHVDPSDVRNQRQSFTIEVDEGVEGSKWTKYKVDRWKIALSEVANLTGMVVSGSEADFIRKIVDTIDCKLDLKLVSIPAHLTGMDTRAEAINSWLNGESTADVLAVCGMGGIGKTTLAQYIYNSNKHKFENSSFLEDIGKHSKQPHGLLGLQNQLLTGILGGKSITISSVSEGTSKIEETLQRKRVLIVLDDIDEQDELGALLGTKAFHTKSKIIITTRLLDIHAWFGSISWRCEVHELELLNDEESLELLSWHAFGSKIPMEGFKELALQLAEYCAGNPLALKVLGSSLFVSAEDPLKRNSIIEIWRSTLNSLNSMKGDLDCKIQTILQRSFDCLPRESHRELFLHIAFFFVGEYEDYVTKILESDWHAKSGIMTLINRCLLTVSPSNKLMMHQLLQEMGRKMVRDESKDPAKRTRVCYDEESYLVLHKGNGSETIEGLALDSLKLEQGMRSVPSAIKTGSLAKMDKLKLLQLKDVELSGSYKNFPKLRWLCWHGCLLKTIRSGLLTDSLVALDMSYGNLQKFEPPMVLNSLKILNLKGSRKLVSIHNLCRLPNLEDLILWDCSSLTHVCKTIRDLESLALLDLTGCGNLWKVSSNQLDLTKIALCLCGGIPEQPLFSLPHLLKFLFLNDSNFQHSNAVHVLFSGQPLFYLNLGNNGFKFLPNYIDLKTLRVLDLTCCYKLKSLLCLPSTLEELYTYRCESLEKITFQSARFRLQKFGYGGCSKLSEIQGLLKLVPIANLDEAALGHLKWIKAYEYCRVDLVGDEITEDRIWHTQMLYEYGIMSIYLQGIKDQNMTTSEYMSSSPSLSFYVPSYPTKRRIRGLNVTFLYRSSGEDEDMWVLFAIICNITKGLTWIYNPVVYCKPPRVGEDAIWLSYWPIGNILDIGDEVNVSIIVGDRLMVSGCGASLVYMDSESEIEIENSENNTKWEEIVGGDLSEFELGTGTYYLCRHDFFKSTIPDWLNMLVGNTIHIADLQGWRKSRWLQHLKAPFMELKTFRGTWYNILPLLPPNGSDKWVWDLDSNGVFSVRKLRELIDTRLLIAHNGSGNTRWCSLVPKKVNVFIWRLSMGGIPLKEVLHDRGFDLDSRLYLKCSSDVEPINKCLIDCSISAKLWANISAWCGENLQLRSSVVELISDAASNGSGSASVSAKVVVIWSSLFIMWRKRNSLVFERDARIDTREMFLEGNLLPLDLLQG